MYLVRYDDTLLSYPSLAVDGAARTVTYNMKFDGASIASRFSCAYASIAIKYNFTATETKTFTLASKSGSGAGIVEGPPINYKVPAFYEFSGSSELASPVTVIGTAAPLNGYKAYVAKMPAAIFAAMWGKINLSIFDWISFTLTPDYTAGSIVTVVKIFAE